MKDHTGQRRNRILSLLFSMGGLIWKKRGIDDDNQSE